MITNYSQYVKYELHFQNPFDYSPLQAMRITNHTVGM